MNIAETQAEGSGHLRIYPAGAPPPNAVAINFSAGQTRSNNVIVPLGPSGDIAVYAGIGPGLRGLCSRRRWVRCRDAAHARFRLLGRRSGVKGK